MSEIVVPVKAVPLGAPVVELDRDGAWVEPSEWRLDPINEVALAWALGARTRGAVARVVAVAVGGGRMEAALRAALARGCDEVLRLDAGGAREVGAVATALAAAIRAREPVAAVACGYESYDGSSGTLPGALAAQLGWPLVSRARDARVDDGVLTAARERDGVHEEVAVATPAVVSFVEGELLAAHPRLAAVLASRGAVVPAQPAGVAPASADWTHGPLALRATPARVRERRVLGAEEGVSELRRLLAAAGAGARDEA